MLKQALEDQYRIARAQDPLKGLRELGWERFLTLGLPEKRTDAFHYLPLSQFYAGTYAAATASTAEVTPTGLIQENVEAHLVFVNGFFAAHLSSFPQDVIVLPLKEALSTYGNFLQNRWKSRMQEEKDPFAALNAALHGCGVFVYVPPKRAEKLQVQCHHIITAPVLAAPRVHLFVGARSEVDWITTVEQTGPHAYWMNSSFDAAIEDSAILREVHLYHDVSPASWFFESRQATLKSSSQLFGVSVTTGAKALRQDYHVTLNGKGADASLHGLWMLQGHQQAHTHVIMDHAAPHCRSSQLFKGVLADASQSSFQGKIFVRPEAQKTEAYQLNKHLLLGERAIANSKPNLEIFADDVKASHGATVAQVEKEQLFYLKARGIPEKTAKGLLVLGFCQELIEQIPIAFVRKQMRAHVDQVLK